MGDLRTWAAFGTLLDILDKRGEADDYEIERKHGVKVYRAYLDAARQHNDMWCALDELGEHVVGVHEAMHGARPHEARESDYAPPIPTLQNSNQL